LKLSRYSSSKPSYIWASIVAIDGEYDAIGLDRKIPAVREMQRWEMDVQLLRVKISCLCQIASLCDHAGHNPGAVVGTIRPVGSNANNAFSVVASSIQ
jgi:hypothetical protein